MLPIRQTIGCTLTLRTAILSSLEVSFPLAPLYSAKACERSARAAAGSEQRCATRRSAPTASERTHSSFECRLPASNLRTLHHNYLHVYNKTFSAKPYLVPRWAPIFYPPIKPFPISTMMPSKSISRLATTSPTA